MESQQRLVLFSQGQVIGATFFGGPLAGAILMSRNYKRLGMPKHASTALLIGLLSTILIIGLGIILINTSVSSIAGIGGLFGMMQWYSVSQREEYERNLQGGGRKESTLVAVGIGIACMIAVVMTLIGIAYVRPDLIPETL